MDQHLRAALRRNADGNEPYVTDNGNFILDCHFPQGIAAAAETERQINDIPGVIENGLFVDLTDIVVIGQEDGNCRILEKS